MNAKKMVLIIFMCNLLSVLQAEIRFKLGEYPCMADNAIKSGFVLKECYGYDSIESWLQKNYSILMVCEFDSIGDVCRIPHVIRRRPYPEKSDRELEIDSLKLLQIIKQNKIKFDVCLDYEFFEFGGTIENLPSRIREIQLFVFFPGQLTRRVEWNDNPIVRKQYLIDLVKQEFEQIRDSAFCDCEDAQYKECDND